MRSLIGLAIIGLLVGPAVVQATTLIGNNPNVNDGGLTVAPGVWIKTGGGQNAGVHNDHTVVPDDGGDWHIGGSNGSGASAAYENYYAQSFAPPEGPGEYDVDFSGWSKAYAAWWSGENWNWLQESHVELLIDGVMVFDGVSSAIINYDTWALHTYSGTHTVNTSIEARLHTVKGNNENGAGGLGAIFWASRYDDIQLDVTLIPEPASLLLFGLPLVFLRRHR